MTSLPLYTTNGFRLIDARLCPRPYCTANEDCGNDDSTIYRYTTVYGFDRVRGHYGTSSTDSSVGSRFHCSLHYTVKWYSTRTTVQILFLLGWHACVLPLPVVVLYTVTSSTRRHFFKFVRGRWSRRVNSVPIPSREKSKMCLPPTESWPKLLR
jgi:hypothetical protein